MIRHVVMWQLADENKQANARELKRRLEGMIGKVEGLRRLEVGVDEGVAGNTCDVVLVSDFEDETALEAYQTHPDHQAIGAFVKPIRVARHQLDYHC